MSRIRRVENRQEFERVIDDYITQGYKVKSRGEMSAQLKEKSYGSWAAHTIIFIVVGWWTLFVANIVYAAIKYSGADSVTVKMDQRAEPGGQPSQQMQQPSNIQGQQQVQGAQNQSQLSQQQQNELPQENS